MAWFARISNGVVVETFQHPENPKALFDPTWNWVSCPSNIKQGATFQNGAFTNPPEPPAPPPPPPAPPELVNIPVPHFKMRLTPQERVAIKEAAEENALVADWLELLNDTRLEYVTLGDPNLTAAIGMLVSVGLLTQERAGEILAA